VLPIAGRPLFLLLVASFVRRLSRAFVLPAFLSILTVLILCGLAAWLIVTQPVNLGAGIMCEAVGLNPSRLHAHVVRIADPRFPRDYTHPENLDRVAGYISDEFLRAGGEVSEQAYKVHGITYRNIVASFGGRTPSIELTLDQRRTGKSISDEESSPVRSGTGEFGGRTAGGGEGKAGKGKPYVVVGAHYDTAGPLPGADDNASGVAGLLELARALGAAPPEGRVDLVAYTLEEPPFFMTPRMGSAVHAASLRREGIEVRAMISLEMIGYFTDAPNSQTFPLGILRFFYPRTGNFIAVVGKLGQGSTLRRIKQAMRAASDLPVESINAPTWIPGVDFSDHRSYWMAGYPAAMITDTAFYRNDRYHTVQDTPESLDYSRMAKVVEGVHCAVRALAT
jgi:hypothetical protein